MKKILITGAGSYIGTSFENYMGQWSDKYSVDTVDMIDGSWREKDFSGYDVVFHVAGIAHIKETKENAELYYKVNRDMAIETAKKAKTEGVKHFVFLSSMSVYGMETGIITKDTEPNPNTNYGKSKLMAEKEILNLEDVSFKIAVLRPPMIYGDGCKGNYNSLIKFANKLPVFPYIKNKRSMLEINNLCKFVKEVIDEEKEGLFFPQNEEYVCTSEMVKGIAEKNGKKIHLTKLLNPFVKLAMIMPGGIGRMASKAFGDLVYDTRKG